MEWQKLVLLLILQLLLCLPSSFSERTESGQNNSLEWNEINNYIYTLNYNRDKVLAFKGTAVRCVKNEGRLDSTNNNFIVITRKIVNITNEKADIGVLANSEHRTFPGSLLLANYRLTDNNPDVLCFERNLLKYTVNLPGLTSENSFTIIPTFADYKKSLNRVLNDWFQSYSNYYDVNAILQHDYSLVYSKDQVRVKFGTEFKNTEIELDIDFDAVKKQEKIIMIHRFKQIFYTVSVETPNKPADFFGPGVTLQDVAGKVNEENPPVIIDSISYGRVIYVKIETSWLNKEIMKEIEDKVKHLLTDFTSIQEYLDRLKMKVYVMGGEINHSKLINVQTGAQVYDIIQYSKFTRQNIGYPLTYTTVFMKDNSRATVKGTAEYIETYKEVFNSGIIKLSHTGWYLVRWVVEWDEISYDEKGEKVVQRTEWDNNGKNITAPFSEEIILKGNCENIHVLAEENPELIWEGWRKVIDRSGLPLINYQNFLI